MSVASYLAAVVSVLVVAGGAVCFGQAARRLLVPDWDGAVKALAVVVLAYGFVIVVAEALGTVGELRRIPIVVTTAVVAGIARVAVPPTAANTAASRPIDRPGPTTTTTVIATVGAALVLAQVLVAVHAVGTTGNTFVDAIEYHLTFAAHFASTGRTTGLIQVAAGDSTSYFPLNDELLNGVGMVLVHRDSLSMLLTAMDLGAAILAAYAFGETFGAGALAVCAITPLLAVLGILDASAPNDWAALWPMLAAVAFMARLLPDTDHRPRLRGLAMIGLAAGLAVGAKLDLLIPILALAIGCVVLSRRRLWRSAGVLLLAGAATGGYWFVRDTIAVGSPLPATHLPGLPRIPMSVYRTAGFSVAHYLGHPHVWWHYFLPGLRKYFGDGWPALLVLIALGIGAGLASRGRPLLRALAIVSIVSLAAYLVTPATAGGPAGDPVSFWVNLRYGLPAMILGLLLVVVASPLSRRPTVTSMIFGLLLAVGLIWRTSWQAPTTRPAVIAVAVCLIIARLLYLEAVRRHALPIGIMMAAVVVIAGYPLQQHYLHDRYRSTATAQDALLAQLANAHGTRVAVAALQPVGQFPFEGPTLTNRVSYLGQSFPDHSFENFVSCPAWRHAVGAGHYNTVVIYSAGRSWPASLRWTRTDRFAHRLFRNPAGAIFRIDPGFAVQPCNAGNTGVR